MSQKRLVEIAIKGKDESKGAFDSLQNSLGGGKLGAVALAAGIAAVGFAVVKATEKLYKFTAEMAALGDELDKMSLRTGIAVEQLSELGFAAERGGGSLQDIEVGSRRLARAMQDASRGTEKQVEAFRRLGISARDLVGADGDLVSIDRILPQIADGMQGIQSQAARMDLAQELFGRGGTALLPMLQQGEAGIRAMREEMQKYGGAMSTEFAGKSAQFADSQTNLANATQRLKEALAEPFLVPFTSAVNTLAAALGGATKIAKDIDIDKEAHPIAMELHPGAKGEQWLQAMNEAREIVRRRREIARLGYDPEFGGRYQGLRPDAYVGSPERLHLPSGDFRGNWHDQSDSMALAWEQANPMEASLEGLQEMLLEVDTASQSLTEGMKLMSVEQANLTIEMERWINTAPFVKDSILNISSSLDQAFFAAMTSTQAFGRAFVDALRRTFADTLAGIAGSWATAGLTSIAGAVGLMPGKTAAAGNKSLPGQAAMFGMGHAQHDAAAAYGKAYL